MNAGLSSTWEGPQCTAGDQPRPFEEIQASAEVFEADPSDPSRGIFRVETTEEAIRAIVWGEDDSFGRFNNG